MSYSNANMIPVSSANVSAIGYTESEQIIEYIRTKKPNAVVIAGDVYDRAVPSVEAGTGF
jgi:Icc-related predicted phosphoesterase